MPDQGLGQRISNDFQRWARPGRAALLRCAAPMRGDVSFMQQTRNHMTAFTSERRTCWGTLFAGADLLAAAPGQNQPSPAGSLAAAQPPPTAPPRAAAQQVAEHGVPLQELAPGAPDSYSVKRGDTLWGIAGLFLKHPWYWPQLWGMNRETIHNPHLIFPGQTLYLEKDGAYARLRSSRSAAAEPDTVRVSPRTRSDSLADVALPTLNPDLVEPFLAEPLVVDPQVLLQAPRVVAMTDDRMLMASGDRVYARGSAKSPLLAGSTSASRRYRVFRDATALKDPGTGEVLAYEAQYLGQAELVRRESMEDVPHRKGRHTNKHVPATIDLSATKGEIQAGDRLLPAPARVFSGYVPRAPKSDVDARVVSLYGNAAVEFAAQNQVVSINKGAQDGIEPGYVLSLVNKGASIADGTEEGKPAIKLPNEINGTAMVFRTFDRVSYALILEIRNAVRVGDRLVNPR